MESPSKIKKIKRKVLAGYEMADFDVAVEFLNTQSYRKKISSMDDEPEYEPYGVCDELSQLK